MTHKTENPRTRPFIAKCIVPVIALILTIALTVQLFVSKLIPTAYIIAICAVFLLFTALTAVLTFRKKRGAFWIGIIIGIDLSILLIIINIMLRHGLSTLDKVTSPKTEQVNMTVYVRKDDPALSLKDTLTYKYGSLESADGNVNELCVKEIEARTGGKISPKDYGTPIKLIDSLLEKETDAIILNAAYIDVISEAEGYENITERIRELDRIIIDVDIISEKPAKEPQKTSNAFTVFISGIDSRTGLITRSRSDVNIIAAINPDTRRILLVSTPRDYFVPLSISNGVRDKLTHAGIYGVQVSMDTLSMLYDIPIDYYFRLDFTGFKNIIDNLGGVTVYSDYEFDSVYHFEKGENLLDGEKALCFVRERHSFASGDHQRGKNQMALISAVIKKAQSKEVLTNYIPLMKSIEGSFETSVPYDMVASLVRTALKADSGWNTETYSVSGKGDSQVTWSQGVRAYVIWPDQDKVNTAKELLTDVISGKPAKAP